MSYLEMLKAVKAEVQGAERGRTLAHPWRGKLVDSPAGQGRLIWTDGYRAAIATEPNVAYFVDLENVRLLGAE